MRRTIFQLIGGLGDGGAETLVKDYALLLDREKFRVIIITLFPPDYSTANSRTLRDNQIEILSLMKGNGFFSHIAYKFLRKYILSRRLLSLIKKEKPQVIHVHLANLYIVDGISSKIPNIKLLYTCHSLPENFIGSKLPEENKSAINLIRNNHMQMVALHDDMRKEINELFGIDNTIVLNNGIDLERYRPLSKDEEQQLREELGISKDRFVVGHVGRFSPVKNHTFILDVFKEVMFRKPNALLLLIGSGALEGEIKNKIHSLEMDESVVILHHRTDINKLMYLMNVFIFPSLFEGLGMVLIEAQASGLKCVVSLNVNQSAILSSKTIPLDLKRSASEWAEVLLDDKIRNNTYGDISKFDLRKEIKKIEKLYE